MTDFSIDAPTISLSAKSPAGPTITVYGNPTDWVKEATISATFTDAASGIRMQEFSLDGKTWFEYTSDILMTQKGTIYFRATNNAGKKTTKKVSVNKIDNEAPVLSGQPTVSVSGQKVTFSWKAAKDNVKVAGYRLTVDGHEYEVTGTSYVLEGLTAGAHSFSLCAYDTAGNVSEKSSEMRFMTSQAARPAGSVLKLSKNKYAYVQEADVTLNNFKKDTKTFSGQKGWMWTDTSGKIVDAEKDSSSADKFILYLNTCWAASASNMFTRAGWSTGLFNSEDDVLTCFTESFTRSCTYAEYQGTVYMGAGLTGGWTQAGVEWLFNGYSSSAWDTIESKGASCPKVSGGFYKSVDLGKYLSAETISIRNGQIQGTGDYVVGSLVMYMPRSFSSTDMLDSASQHLKDGDAVTLSVGWYAKNTWQQLGGHAITVYGYTYDETKKGKPQYYTGLIVADSDDDFSNKAPGHEAKGCPDRVKILNLTYLKDQGLYVFSNYGNSSLYGVVEGFEYLGRRPENITNEARSKIVFSVDGDWNASYSVSDNEKAAVEGVRGVISTTDDVYIALSLTNSGLGESSDLLITTTIDGNEEGIKTYSIAKQLAYKENCSDVVINIGKLEQGVHSIVVFVSADDATETITVDNICVSSDDRVANTLGHGEVSPGEFLVVNDIASDIVVHGGGRLFASQYSEVTGTVVEAGGMMNVDLQGKAANTKVSGELSVTNGTAENTTVLAGGAQEIRGTGESYGATINDGATQCISSGGYAEDNTFSGAGSQQHVSGSESRASHNSFEGDGASQFVLNSGVVENNDFSNGAVQYVSNGAIAIGTNLYSGSMQNVRNAFALDTVVHEHSAAFVFENAESFNCSVEAGGRLVVGAAAVRDLSVKYGGDVLLETGAVLHGETRMAGTLTVNGKISGETPTPQDSAPGIIFDFSGRSEADDYIVNDISLCENLFFSISLSENQANGVYRFSGAGAEWLADSITVCDSTGKFYGDLSLQDTVVMGDQMISLVQDAGSLCIVVDDSPYQLFEIPLSSLETADNVCSWGHVADTEGYIVQFSQDNFNTFVSVKTSSESISVNNVFGTLQWRVRAVESGKWTVGDDIVCETADKNLVSTEMDGAIDLVFASVEGKWTDDFAAQHVGVSQEWEGLGEVVSLSGKNRISSIFEVSPEDNILVLTDDEHGDALFVDDVYTVSADFIARQQARIAQIREIRAGAGDDLVDMTSQKFAYDGGNIVIRGGAGNDTIWANNGQNMLFGDGGDDVLVGAEKDDILVGGIGDDTMHGGGGNDVFVFCDNWGTDHVEQLENGNVVLWFASGDESGWDASTMTFSSGGNSVKVDGVSADRVTLKFGDDGSPQYLELVDKGAFSATSSESIFEKNGDAQSSSHPSFPPLGMVIPVSQDVDDWNDLKTKGQNGAVGVFDIDVENEGEIGGGDLVDYLALTLNSAAKVAFSVSSENATKFTVNTLTGLEGKYALKVNQTTNVGAGETVTTKQLLLEKGTYYIGVAATDKKAAAADYTICLDDLSSVFFTEGDNSDDWQDVKTNGENGAVGKWDTINTISDWVGHGDAVDYKAIHLDHAAEATLTISSSEAAKVTLYRLEKTEKKGVVTYSLKKLQSTTTKRAQGQEIFTATSKGRLLEAGDYYVAVESTNAKKGGNTDYTLSYGENKMFDKGDNTDDWTDMKTNGASGLVASVGTVADPGELLSGWVGFGDAVDYTEFTLENAADLVFDVIVGDAAKFTIYSLQGKTDKNGATTYSLKKLQSTSFKTSGSTKNLLLEKGTYYMAMESTNAKKGGYVDYTISVDETSRFFPAATDNNTWQKATKPEDDTLSGWVGFGDKADYWEIQMSETGKLTLDFDEFTSDAIKRKKVKITCLDDKGKSVSLVWNGDTMQSKKEILSDCCYVGITCANEKKFNTYNITVLK
ncbi:MAG: hypothetical protein MJ025_04560 [Victivallaceae bacterium]|nr:hypothetical protein [Victivallaceae bacterium]